MIESLGIALGLSFVAGAFTQWVFDRPRYRPRVHRAKG